ncbi:MAG: ETC complex I subunit [Rhodospirillaceae bacterium]|nr:ETC complex I subunit [Rhodospirillales bacterium]
MPKPVITPLPDHIPLIDPENARFTHSGAEMPSFDQMPDAEAPPPEEGAQSVHHGASPEPAEMMLATARIYRRSPNPMQQGRARMGQWTVEFEPHLKPGIDPLMGWTSSGDPLQQVRLTFPSEDEAVAFCRRQKLPFDLEKPAANKPKPKSYSSNFVPFEDGTPKPIYPH